MLSTGNKVQNHWYHFKVLTVGKQIIERFSEDIPVQAENGVVFKRTDLKSLHERSTLTYQTTHGMC